MLKISISLAEFNLFQAFLLSVPFFFIYRSLRRKHLDSLRESEEKYRSIIETMEVQSKFQLKGV
jgi:hypothetical protein